MLKLLLDEHVPPALAEELPRHRHGSAVVALQDFENGTLLGARDERILTAAAAGGWTLLTYDQRTIPVILMTWGEQGTSHGGVIFVDRKTLQPSDIGGLVRALLRLWQSLGGADWHNRVVHLVP